MSYRETQDVNTNEQLLAEESQAGGSAANEEKAVTYLNLAYTYAQNGQCNLAVATIAKARQVSPPSFLPTVSQSANYTLSHCHQD